MLANKSFLFYILSNALKIHLNEYENDRIFCSYDKLAKASLWKNAEIQRHSFAWPAYTTFHLYKHLLLITEFY